MKKITVYTYCKENAFIKGLLPKGLTPSDLSVEVVEKSPTLSDKFETKPEVLISKLLFSFNIPIFLSEG